MSTTIAENSPTQALAGKYLTFVLGSECYAIAVLRIREIIRLLDITAVPQMPRYIKGVINLRGRVIPIVDLRIKFGLTEVKNTERTCIVVVQITHPSGLKSQMGLLVDAVEDVLNLSAREIEKTPEFGATLDTEYILAMANVKGSVKTLLDIDKVVAAEYIQRVEEAVGA